ncbi:MAG: hypothetical protein A2X46_04410 [Lentisphaerae bacterium GWF2_57_35]|nr:MAG: hypothetical protein A2X46_04410 [Lentisphaerae bacterium GWF2_57_35]
MSGIPFILSAALQVLGVIVVSFAGIAVLASYLRHEEQADAAADSSSAQSSEAEFVKQLGETLRSARRDRCPVAVVSLGGFPEGFLLSPESEVVQTVRAALRRDDVVSGFDTRLGFILGAGKDVLPGILKRVQEVVRRVQPAIQLRAGIAVYPEDGDRAGDLWSRAMSSETEWPPVNVMERTAGAILTASQLAAEGRKFFVRREKNGEPVSLIVLDVDFLPRYAERYGGEAVDVIQRALGLFLRGAVRVNDLVGRFEGGEWAIVLSCRPQAALQIAGRILEGVKALSIVHADSTLKIAVSAGVAGSPENGRAMGVLVEAASSALREIRAQGRGLCLLYQGTPKSANPPKDHSASAF